MNTVRQLLRYLTAYKRLLVLLVVVATFVVAIEGLGLGFVFLLLGVANIDRLGLSLPLIGEQVGELIALPVTTRIYAAAGALVAITFVRSGLQFAQQLLSIRLRRQVERDLQIQLFNHFHELSLQDLQRERRGTWTVLLRQYTRQVGSLTLQFGGAVSSSVILIAYVAIAFVISWFLTLVSLVVLLPTSLLLRPLIGTRLHIASRKTRDRMRDVQNVTQEHLRAMKIIRLFGQESWSQGVYQQKLNDYLSQEYQAAVWAALARPLFALINVVLLAGVIILGVTTLPGSPDALVAQLLIFLTIALRLTAPIGNLARFQTEVTQTAPMLDAIRHALEDEYERAPRSGDLPFSKLRHAVEFKHVSFGYSPDEAMVLHDINLQIRHNQITAIVGVSGGGKSSLVNLVARLYDPVAGHILIDGTDLRLLDLAAWHKRISVVSQEVILFHATVWDNLRFGCAEATDADIIQAAKLAQCHDFILELPQGYETLLQEEGLRLSGGQRQRIALARALLAHADLLVLDEATSELDAMTEQAVQQTLRAYAQAHTVLVIAHRLANVVEADKIYVMKEGSIIEEGSHADLMRNNKIYAQMVQAQQL